MTDLYFDFLCPYAWRGVELAAVLRTGDEAFRLRPFSLVQGNHEANKEGVNWHLSEQPLVGEEEKRGTKASLGAFLAFEAAAQQGEEAAWAHALALFRLHREQEQPLTPEVFEQAAREADLDLAAWQLAQKDEAGLRAKLREELLHAAEQGIFGTPTFALGDDQIAYFKFETLTRDPAEAHALWKVFTATLGSSAQIATIRRPAPPRS